MSKKLSRAIRRAVASVVEMLESRQMLSIVPLTAASGDTNLTIAYNAETQQYVSTGGLNTPAPVAAASVTGFTVTGGGASAMLTVLSGDPTLLNDAGSDGTSLSVIVDAGASLSFDTTEHLASLTVDASATARMLGTHQVLDTSGPTLSGSTGAWTGTLDLGSSDMIVHGGNIATLTSEIASGYNGGNWNGSGIQSSGAASDPTHLTALGILANNTGGSTPIYPTFDGQTAVSTDVLVKTTIYGDANLDGHVDGTDYSRIDNGYLSNATGWGNGDFNYDGVINGSDYTLIDNAFNTQPGSPTPAIRLSGDSTVEPGSTYTLDYTVVGDQIPSAISINWGDGNISTVAGSSTSDTHTYSLSGSYAVAVTAMMGGSEYTSSSFGLDSSFGQAGMTATTAPLTAVDAIVLKPDGTTVVLDATNGLLESFNSDGTVNTSFGSEGITHLTLSTVAKALAVDQSGNVYVAGIDSDNNLVVEQITSAGVLNTTSYGAGGNALVLSSAPSNILAGGAALLAVPTGSTTSEEILSVDDGGAFEVARLLSDGTPDSGAGSGGTGIFNGPNVSLAAGADVQGAIALDGNLLLAGRTATGTVLEQFNKSGGSDTAFNGGATVTLTNSVTSLAVSGSGNIFVGTVSASNQAYIDALQANGSAGSTFGAAGVVQLPVGIVNGGITSLTVQSDNDLLAVGAGTGGVVLAAEYADDGSLDSTFGTGGLFAIPLTAAGFVSAASAVVQPDGQAIIAATANAGTSSAGNVLRLNQTNQIIVQQSLTLVPYKQASPIFAGTAVILTAQGDALPGSDGALNWSEYLGGNLVESVSAAVADDGYSFAFSTLNPGQYVVDVVGNGGASASYSFTVLANSPTVSISGPASANPSSVVVLIANAAHDPLAPSPDDLNPSVQTAPGDAIDATLDYSWSVSYQASGEAIVPFNLPTGTPTTLPSLYFETGAAGSYITTLQVVSSDGGSSTTVTHKINVGGVAPTVSLTPVTTALAYNLSEAHSVVVQPDGKIVVAGLTDGSSAYPIEIAVVRYNKDLSLDTTFGDGTGIVYLSLGSNIEDLDILGDGGYDSVPIALQPDGKILVGTYQATDIANIQAGGDGYSEIFRLNTDGTPDLSFNSSGVVLTQFTQQTLDPINGSPDSVIDTTGVLGLKVLDSGEIVATQELTDGDNNAYWAVTRFSGSGQLDPTFGNGGVAVISVPGDGGGANEGKSVIDLEVASDGTYYLGGVTQASVEIGFNISQSFAAIAAIDSNGQPVSDFGNQGASYPGVTVTQFSDGPYDSSSFAKLLLTTVSGTPYIVAAGTAKVAADDGSSATLSFAFAEYTLTGQLVPGFGGSDNGMTLVSPETAPDSELADAALLPDGSIIAVGDNNYRDGSTLPSYTGVASSTNIVFVELKPDGTADSTLGGDGEDVQAVPYNTSDGVDATLAYGLAIEGDTWIIVGGAYTDPSSGFSLGPSNYLVLQFEPDIEGATQLTATATPAGTINLNWASVGGIGESFGIERGPTESGPFTTIGSTLAGATSYTDSTVLPGMTYWYEVYAITSSGPAGYSNPASATTSAANEGYQYLETITVPIDGTPVYSNVNLSSGVPYLLVATGDISQTEDGTHRGDAEYGEYPVDGVTNWWLNNPETTNTLGYEYGISVGANATALNGVDTKYPYWGPLATDSNHTYSVIYTPTATSTLAANYHDIYYPDNTTGNAGDIPLQVAIYQPLPPTPSGLIAQGNTAERAIDLSWTLPTVAWLSGLYGGSETVAIERSSDGGSTFTNVATVPASQTTWFDNTISPNTSYVYRVFSQVGGGQSEYSNAASATWIVNAPYIQPIVTQTAVRGAPFTLQVQATDPQYELDGLNYSLSNSSTGLTINSNGLIQGWTPTTGEAGDSYFLTVTATDSAGISSSASFTINVPQGNSPIQITAPASIRKISGNQYALSVGATEPGVDPSDLFYTWSMQWNDPSDSSPPTPAFSPQGTNEAQNSVATLFAGGDAYDFVVTVTDSLGNVPATSAAGLSVAPVLSSLQITVPQSSIEIGSMPETLTAQGIDQFGNSITASSVSWFVTSGNASGSFNNATGQFTPTSTPGVVTVLATAPVGISTVSATATISVSGLSAPDGLTTGVVDPNSVPLMWNASTGSNLAGYDVLESLSQQGPFVTALNGTLVSNTSTSISTIPGTTYYFEVVAQDTNGIDSPPSNVLSVPVPQEDSSFPPAPTGLVAGVAAVNYGGITRVALDWNAVTGQHILGYDVYRSSIPNFVPMTSNLIGSSIDNEYVDNSSLTSGNYYYVVETANDLGDSAPSNQASVNLSGPVYAPTAPINVTATALGGTSVQVTWTDTSYNETEFLITRSNSTSGPWTQVGMVPTNVTSFTDTISSLGTATYYEITAVNPAGSATSAPTSGIEGGTPMASGIVLVPAHGSVQTGGSDQITAEVVDQYGNPLASQPSSFTWSVESGGAGGMVSSSGLYTAPSTLNTVNGVLVNADTIEATADGLTGQVSVQAVIPQPPVVQITSVDTSDGPALLTQDTEIDGIVVDPADGSISYTLTATAEAGGGAITISTGTSQVGAVPSQSGSLGTVSVASMPDGVYTLTLTATDQFGLTSNASVLIQVQSALKLGNLTLPFTDLTINPSGSNPVPITRTYDSSTASTDTGLGYGWTLNVTGTNLRSTVPPQTGIDEAPGYQDGNLLYITTPDGVQHTFEFLANPTGDFEDNPLAGFVGQLETYTPQFLCADGSGSKLILADDNGNDISSTFTLYQDDGRYINDGDTGQDWFNPANPTFGLQYILITSNGTQYSVDPSSGQLESVTDANGNTTGYSDGPPYTTTTAPNGTDIGSITDTATGQTVQYYYSNDAGNADDTENDLIGFIDPAGNKTTYIYGDQLIVPYSQTASVYAVITRTSDGDVWNTETNTWSPAGANDQLSLSVIDDSAGTPAWYTATGPAITPGTIVSIAYFKTGTSTAIYTEARTWSAPHLLTGIIDSSGVTVLTATYDPASSQLASLVNTDKQASSLSTGGFDGTTGDQTATDAAGDTTENIYDAYGDVIRKIQTIESDGTIEGYMVTVASYSFFGSAQAQVSFDEDFAQAGVDPLNDPTGEVTYAPFEVTGSDPDGLRYSEQPPTPPEQIITYYQWNGDPNSLTGHPEYGQIESEMNLVGPGTTNGDWIYNVSNYSGYSFTPLGKPTTTTQQLGEYSVGLSGSTTFVQTVGASTTTSISYDGNGNLMTNEDADGVTTKYTYTDDTGGVPAGLVLDTYQSSYTASGGWALLSSNNYYGSTNASIGAVAGLLESATTYNYEVQGGTLATLSQTTYDVYDAQGNILLTYTPKNVGTAISPDWVWSASSTTYNMDGQTLSTSQATYTDPVSPGSSADEMNIAVTWNMSPDSNTTGEVVVTETLNAPVAPLPSGQTSYTPTGQTQTTTDQYGGVTTDTYDASGNLVRTLYPDGTEVRSVYNALGDVIWQTDRYATTTLAHGTDDNTTTANATETMYDSLGQIVGTERFSGVLITLGTDPNADEISGLEESTLVNPSNPGAPISLTSAVYNATGQEVETDSPSGLRTGTIYNSDGNTEFTGTLNPTASATWYLSANPAGSFLVDPATGRAEYTQYVYNQVDTLSGDVNDPWYGLVYNETIQNDGHSASGQPAATHTNTFEDSSGRIIFTVYDDGSFTQALYSIGDQAITSSNPYVPTGYTPLAVTIPAGGSETINIAQRKAGDAIDATIDVYDSAGNLVDVYAPPVADALNSDTMTNPHTHYDYNASGEEIDQIDAKGNETSWTYDANGDELSRTLPDGESESFTYNVYGQLATHTDFDGNMATSTYYSNYSSGAYAGSLEQVVYVGAAESGKTTETVSYTYTALDQQQTVNDSAEATTGDMTGTTTDYYDAQGNLDEQITPEGTIWYVFDPTTGEHIETKTNYTDTLYGYNTQGELISVTVDELNGNELTANSATPPLVTSYTYDGAGNELTETLPDGEVTNYAYDDLNRLTGLVEKQGATTLFSETLILNDDGSRRSAVETQLQADGTTVVTTDLAWTYDAMGRLLTESLSATGSSTAATEDYSDIYTYDLASNRHSDVHTGPGDGATGTTTYTYNDDDQLTQQVSSVNGTTNFTYDNNGSQLNSTNGTTVTAYTYDVRNKMVAFSNGTTSATYVYDDDGNRVQETVGGTTTYYLTDTQNPTGYAQPVEQRSSPSGPPTLTYLIGNRVFGQANSSGSVTYFLTDAHGSTIALINAAATTTHTVTATLAYTAFGDALNFTPATIGTAYQFGGDSLYDIPSGLSLHGDGVRPTNGFYFTQMDGTQSFSPTTNPIALQNYLYAGANPVMMVDPSGHDEEAEELAVASIGTGLEAGLTLSIRVSMIVYRVTLIVFRVAEFWPAIAVGATVASAVLSAGAQYAGFVAQRWSELQAVPTGIFGISRGNFLHQQANSNLGPYFPVIDDFRNGYATSIKTTAVGTQDGLLSNIRGYLQQMVGIERDELRGSDSNGMQLVIDPGEIQAKGLLVAIPSTNQSILQNPTFAAEVQALADEFETAVKIVPVDAFEE